MIIGIVILFFLISIFSAISNPDLFSPTKIYLFFFMTFHLGILFQDITLTTSIMIMGVLLVAVPIAFIEAGQIRQSNQTKQMTPGAGAGRDYTVLFWLASGPGILAQMYMIQYFGGIEGYVNSVGLRVVEWAGFGWARSLIALIVPINLAYFALGLRKRKGLTWWMIYTAHLLILLGIGILSGSRSSLLNVFVMQAVIYHYVGANVKARHAALMASALIAAAMVLGVVRETTRYSGGELTLTNALSDRVVSYTAFSYGVLPLEIIARTEHPTLAYGSTFLSVVTNAVPRSLWPDKPETGGVFFTRNYTGDAWEGFSNLTPTFLGEWLINFGWIGGVLGFFMSSMILLLFLNRYYVRIVGSLEGQDTDEARIRLVIYVQALLGVAALMVGEVTNVVLLLILTQILPLWMLRVYLIRVAR